MFLLVLASLFCSALTPCCSLYVNYFAYGSNLNPDVLSKRTLSRTRSFTPVRCILKDYKLVFNIGISSSSYASVEPLEGYEVHGLLYTLTFAQFGLLRATEPGYKQQLIEVWPYSSVDEDNKYVDRNAVLHSNSDSNNYMGRKRIRGTLPALTLCSGNGVNDRGRPSPRYSRLIIRGAKEQKLHQSYCDYLKNIEAYKKYR